VVLGHGDELALFAVVGQDGTVGDVEDPAIEIHVLTGEGGGNAGVSAEVVELGEDVFLDHDFVALGVGEVGVAESDAAGAFGMVEPGADDGHLGDGIGVHGGVHGAAVGVAAEDDVFDAEDHDGVFDGGGDAAHGFAVGGDDVAGVADGEEVTGFRVGDHVGDDARIGAGDEEGAGELAGDEFVEEVFTLGVDFAFKAEHAFC
jgi:hypothetical protein